MNTSKKIIVKTKKNNDKKDVLAQNIKLIRIRKRFKQKEFAEMLGVKANYLSRWENGKLTPDVLNLKKIAEITNQSIEWFFKNNSDILEIQEEQGEYESIKDLQKEIELLKREKAILQKELELSKKSK